MIVCRYCLEELISRGEEITIEEQIHDAGHCGWCDEDDEELYRVSFKRASARVGMDNAIKNTI